MYSDTFLFNLNIYYVTPTLFLFWAFDAGENKNCSFPFKKSVYSVTKLQIKNTAVVAPSPPFYLFFGLIKRPKELTRVKAVF